MKSYSKSPEGGTCKQCLCGLGAAALKCMKCTAYVHLRCSGLPEYHVVRLASSQTSYMCVACVGADFADDGYEQELRSVQEIISKEMESIKELDGDVTIDKLMASDTESAAEGVIPDQASSGMLVGGSRLAGAQAGKYGLFYRHCR